MSVTLQTRVSKDKKMYSGMVCLRDTKDGSSSNLSELILARNLEEARAKLIEYVAQELPSLSISTLESSASRIQIVAFVT